jgi:hypothetical protein
LLLYLVLFPSSGIETAPIAHSVSYGKKHQTALKAPLVSDTVADEQGTNFR